MATSHIYDYCGNVGRVWSNFVIHFNSYAISAGITALNVTLDTSTGYRDLQLDAVQGANNVITHLIDTAMPATERYRADYLQGLPGWMTMFGPTAPVNSGKDFLVLFANTAIPTRELIWAQYTNATIQASGLVSWTIQPIGSAARNSWRVWTDNPTSGMDWITAVAQLQQGTTGRWANSASPAEMGRSPSVPVTGGGGELDTGAIVAALNDIALIDVDYTANNGGAVWSMRGKVRT